MSRLSGKSKFSWGYAITEVILIALGISLAFVLNNWSEGKRDKKLEQFYLSNIKSDLDQAVRNLDYHLALDSFQREGAIKLFPLLKQGLGADRDSLRIYLNSFNTNPRFKVNDSNYQSLLLSGDYRIIRNEELRRALDDFFLNQMPSVITTEGYYIDRLDDHYFPVKERIYMAYSDSFVNISGLFDPFFIDNVYVLPAYIDQEMRQLKRASDAGKALSSLLSSEIK